MSDFLKVLAYRVRCVFCHAVGVRDRMLYIKGNYYCSAACHNKDNKRKL